MRLRLRSWLPLGLGLALLVGCSGGGVRPEVVQSFVGQPVGRLQETWGPPTRVVPDGDLSLHIYEELERRTSRSFNQQDNETRVSRDELAARLASDARRPPSYHARSYRFWANSSGVIVRADIYEP